MLVEVFEFLTYPKGRRQNSLSSCYNLPHSLSLCSLCLPLTKIKSSLTEEFQLFMENTFMDQCLGTSVLDSNMECDRGTGWPEQPRATPASRVKTTHQLQVRRGGGAGNKRSASDHFGVRDSKVKPIMLGFLQRPSLSTSRPQGIDGPWKCSLDL